MINFDDAMSQLTGLGLIIDKPLRFDSSIQRWRVDGEDHERRGWSRLKEWTSKANNTYIVGDFGVWHGNDDGRMRVEMPAKDDNRPALTQEDIAAMRQAQKEAQRRLAEVRKIEAKTAGRWAGVVWGAADPCADHDYLTKKGIKPHGLRVIGKLDDLNITGVDESNVYRLRQATGAIAVPMHDQHGNVCGLQFIYPAGHPRRAKIERDKEFWPAGMAIGGTFGVIGHIRREGVLLVAEGYATAASLHESTGQAVAYAFSANNLVKAGKQLRKQYPSLKLLFCADDDYLTDGNPGVTAAVQATAEIEGTAWIKPDFTDEAGNDQRNGKKLTDYNDLYALTGLTLILANQINAKLEALKWRDASAIVAAVFEPGSGEGRRGAVSIMSADDLVARFIPIDDGRGKCLFDTWTMRLVHRDQMNALMSAGINGDEIKRHPLWVSRGSYYLDQVGFDPEGVDKNVKLNTWRGWPIEPKKGDCSPIRDLGMFICSKEPALADQNFKWLWQRLCWIFQNPGKKLPHSIIVQGPQGSGKSMFFNAFSQLAGLNHPFKSYALTLNQAALEDKHNAEFANKLIIVAEEAISSGEKWNFPNIYKELVSGETHRIRPLFTDAYYVKNYGNYILISNEVLPLPLEMDDRRNFVIETPPPLSKEFYKEVREWVNGGGLSSLMYEVLNEDLSDFEPYENPPTSAAKKDLIHVSMSSDDRFIKAWAEGETPYPFVPVGGALIYAAYQRWCRVNGVSRPRESNLFIAKIAKKQGWSNDHKSRFDNSHYQGKTKPCRTVMPPGVDAPSDKTQSQWLTDCFFQFKGALDADQ